MSTKPTSSIVAGGAVVGGMSWGNQWDGAALAGRRIPARRGGAYQTMPFAKAHRTVNPLGWSHGAKNNTLRNALLQAEAYGKMQKAMMR